MVPQRVLRAVILLMMVEKIVSLHTNKSFKIFNYFHNYTETNDNYNDIIECGLYALTGILGKYLRKDIVTGEFKLDLRAKNLSYTDAGMLLRLAKVG